MKLLLNTVLCLVFTCTAGQGPVTPQAQDTSVLAVKVHEFTVQDVTMEEAIRRLRRTDTTHILIGFENVAHGPDETGKKTSISVQNETVGDIIAELCRKDPRYTFETIDKVLLHVFPRNHLSDPARLLDIKIARFSVDDKMTPSTVILQVPFSAPELWSFMAKKSAEYHRRNGEPPAGSGGSAGSGSGDPSIHIHLRNVTVRQLLDDIALYSRELNAEMLPDPTGYKIPPTSWIYEFVIDPNASTGLGGTPRWVAF